MSFLCSVYEPCRPFRAACAISDQFLMFSMWHDILEVSKPPIITTGIQALAHAMVDPMRGGISSEEPECVGIVVLEVPACVHECLDHL